MTIFTHVFQVRNVSKLPPNTCLERDKVRIQKPVIPNPGSSPARGPPQPWLNAPAKCKHRSRKSLSTNIPRVTKRHSPSLPLCSHTTFLGLLWGRFMTASSSAKVSPCRAGTMLDSTQQTPCTVVILKSLLECNSKLAQDACEQNFFLSFF